MFRIAIISWVIISFVCGAVFVAAVVDWENVRTTALVILGITSLIFLTITIVWSIEWSKEKKNDTQKGEEQVKSTTRQRDITLRTPLLIWQIISTICVGIALAPEVEWESFQPSVIVIWGIATVSFLLFLVTWLAVKNKKRLSQRSRSEAH